MKRGCRTYHRQSTHGANRFTTRASSICGCSQPRRRLPFPTCWSRASARTYIQARWRRPARVLIAILRRTDDRSRRVRSLPAGLFCRWMGHATTTSCCFSPHSSSSHRSSRVAGVKKGNATARCPGAWVLRPDLVSLEGVPENPPCGWSDPRRLSCLCVTGSPTSCLQPGRGGGIHGQAAGHHCIPPHHTHTPPHCLCAYSHSPWFRDLCATGTQVNIHHRQADTSILHVTRLDCSSAPSPPPVHVAPTGAPPSLGGRTSSLTRLPDSVVVLQMMNHRSKKVATSFWTDSFIIYNDQ